MGLGLSVRTPLKSLSKKAAAKELQVFCQAIADAVSDDVMRAYAAIEEAGEAAYMTLHPGAEPVSVTIDDGWIVVDAKTSGVGPGYHAALVELLDRVGVALKQPWDWNDEDACVDETGFALRRDFGRLQEAMLAHFRALCQLVVDPKKTHDGPLFMDWNLEGPKVDGPWAAVTPVGTWTREWFVNASRDATAKNAAAEFFGWWNKDRDQLDKAKVVATFLWSECRWHPPVDEREKAFLELILALADQASQHLSKYNVTKEDVAELRAMAQSQPDDAPMPREGGIGVYRGDAPVMVPGGWWFEAPGYMYREVEDDGGVLLLWHAGRTIRISTFSPRLPNGRPVAAQQLLRDFSSEAPSGGKPVRSREGQLMRQHTIVPPSEDEEWHHLSGCAAIDGEVAFITIAFEDAGEDGWAAEVFNSLRISEDVPVAE